MPRNRPLQYPAPVVSLPASTTFPNAMDVTISATDDSGATPTIYYTTDGSTPTESSASVSGSITLNLTATTTVKAFAVDGSNNASAVSSETYTRDDSQPTGFKVYFQTDFANPTVYFWGGTATTSWLGESMTDEGNGWFSYEFPTGCTNLIFNNNGASQTADLSICQEGWYENGSWSFSNPSARIEKVDFGLTNYPNPFSGLTNIRFNLLESGFVNITIFDAQGKVIETLNDGNLEAGRHLIMFDGSKLNAGLYFCKMNANGQSLTQKLMIVK